ncbi:MAG: TMEM175 family protein [Actinomycetota bacterium]
MSRPARKAFDPRSEGSTSRLQTLADGFFAVAMTLLVLDLSTGETGRPVTEVLRDAWPHLLLFFDGMLVLGALWFGHRNAFEYIRRTDHPHTWLTLAMLAFVALVPWTTALVARHFHEPLAITVYAANLAIVTALDGAAWFYATARPQLTERLTPRLIEVSRLMSAVPVVGFVLVSGLAWLSTWAALAIVAALPLLPITGISYRMQYRLGNRAGSNSDSP